MLWDNSVKSHVRVQSQSLNLFLVFVLALLTFGVIPTSYAHAGRLTLAWDANDDANDAGYKLYYGNSSQEYRPYVIPTLPCVRSREEKTVCCLPSASNKYILEKSKSKLRRVPVVASAYLVSSVRSAKS